MKDNFHFSPLIYFTCGSLNPKSKIRIPKSFQLSPFTFHLLQWDIPMLLPRVIHYLIFKHFKRVDELDARL